METFFFGKDRSQVKDAVFCPTPHPQKKHPKNNKNSPGIFLKTVFPLKYELNFIL